VTTTWIIIRDPGCVPDRKGPFPDVMVKQFLVEALEARMGSFVTVATIDGTDLRVEDGPQCLEIMDGRYRHLARRHRASTKPHPN
jgi:hypothetical protein